MSLNVIVVNAVLHHVTRQSRIKIVIGDMQAAFEFYFKDGIKNPNRVL